MSGQPDAVRVGELLRRQEQQAEAKEIIGTPDLSGVLGRVGSVWLIGNSVTSLMVWRDLDLQVLSPGPSAAEIWEVVQPFAAHPRVHEVRYLYQAGANSFSGDPRDGRHWLENHGALVAAPQKSARQAWTDEVNVRAAGSGRFSKGRSDSSRASFLAGAPPGEDPRRASSPAGSQGRRVHLRADAARCTG
jgi:hypothetical protein